MPVKILLVIIILIIPLAPTFWAIMDIPRRRFSSSRAKVIWFAVVTTLPFLGAMIYILLVRRRTQPIE
jgi:hypothetical protein